MKYGKNLSLQRISGRTVTPLGWIRNLSSTWNIAFITLCKWRLIVSPECRNQKFTSRFLVLYVSIYGVFASCSSTLAYHVGLRPPSLSNIFANLKNSGGPILTILWSDWLFIIRLIISSIPFSLWAHCISNFLLTKMFLDELPLTNKTNEMSYHSLKGIPPAYHFVIVHLNLMKI